MISITIIISFLVICVPLTFGIVLCKNGEKIYNENLIYNCVEGKKIYYGCMIDGVEIKQNTTKDENNLRRHLCYKNLNDVKPNIIIGCVTDDNIFIDETKTVKQADGSILTCTKQIKGFTVVKEPSPSKTFGCNLGKTKTVSNRFLLECKRKNQTHNSYQLVACYPVIGNHHIRVTVKKTYDNIVNKNKGYGFRYQCHSTDNQYLYDLVGCLVGEEFIQPDDIYLNETVAVLCLQEGPDKLRIKPFTHNKFLGKSNCSNAEVIEPSEKIVLANSNNDAENTFSKKCSDSWTLNDHTGFCYKVFSQSNWDEAQNRCAAENSTLASVHSLEEARFIANLSYSSEAESWFWKTQAWIGLHNTDTSTDWKGVDNTPFDYVKWGINEPDDDGRQHCGYIRITASSTITIADVGDFQNTLCSEVLSKFVCKKASL